MCPLVTAVAGWDPLWSIAMMSGFFSAASSAGVSVVRSVEKAHHRKLPERRRAGVRGGRGH
jgi:hypothetical protein